MHSRLRVSCIQWHHPHVFRCQWTQNQDLRQHKLLHARDSIKCYVWNDIVECKQYIYSISQEICTRVLLLCFVVVIHWLILPYPSGLLHWHCGNLTIAPVPAKQPWWIWRNTSYEFIMNDCITTTKQSTTKPCAYFLGYTVCPWNMCRQPWNNCCIRCPR